METENTPIVTDKPVVTDAPKQEIPTEFADIPKDIATVDIPQPSPDKKEVKEVDKEVKEVKEDKPVVSSTEKKEEKKEVKSEFDSLFLTDDEVKKISDSDKNGKPSVDIKPTTTEKKEKEVVGDDTDFTGFSDAEVTNLKEIPAKQRKEITQKLREYKTLQQGQYLQHPDGYLLTPEYREIKINQHFGQLEAHALQKSLIDIKAERNYREITGFDKDGNPVLSAEKPPSVEAEIDIQNKLQTCLSVLGRFNSQLAEIPKKHIERIKGVSDAVVAEQKKRFAWSAKPELLDKFIQVTRADGSKAYEKIRNIKDNFRNLWPIYMRGHNAVDVASDLMVNNILTINTFQKQIADRDKEIALLKAGKAEKEKVHTVDGSITPPPKINSNDKGTVGKFSPEMFETLGKL